MPGSTVTVRASTSRSRTRLQVLREVDHQRRADRLPGQRRAAAARQDRHAVAGGQLDRGRWTSSVDFGNDHADRLDLVVGGVGGVEHARDGVEADLASDAALRARPGGLPAKCERAVGPMPVAIEWTVSALADRKRWRSSRYGPLQGFGGAMSHREIWCNLAVDPAPECSIAGARSRRESRLQPYRDTRSLPGDVVVAAYHAPPVRVDDRNFHRSRLSRAVDGVPGGSRTSS